VIKRHIGVAATLAVLGAALVGACGAIPSGPGSDRAYRIATASAPHPFFTEARAEGQLSATSNWDGTACLWITMNANQLGLIWPYDYTAKGSPIAVYDETGLKVASAGQHVILAGAPTEGVSSIVGCGRTLHSFWAVGQVQGS
jgi:hypothetical protein